jgi:hypothetical protein
VSALAHYKRSGFSIGRLIDFLAALDRDVESGYRRRTHDTGISTPANSNRPDDPPGALSESSQLGHAHDERANNVLVRVFLRARKLRPASNKDR